MPMGQFETSKIIWFLVEPSHLLTFALVLSAVLIILRYRAGRALAAACGAVCLLLLLEPVGDWALRPLENCYPRPRMPSHADGILVLDEGSVIEAYVLARRHPKARVIFSGGTADAPDIPQTEIARGIFGELGMDRVTYESNSRNTWENLEFSAKLAQPKPREIWLLVAPAYRLRLAMIAAKRVGWTMVPWPSNYLTSGRGSDGLQGFPINLFHLDLAAHEWLGLFAYRFFGKTL